MGFDMILILWFTYCDVWLVGITKMDSPSRKRKCKQSNAALFELLYKNIIGLWTMILQRIGYEIYEVLKRGAITVRGLYSFAYVWPIYLHLPN